MGARGEVVREPVPWSTLPVAKAWLLGYVRTDAPGYREVIDAGNLVVVASGEYRFDAYVTAINAALVYTDDWAWGPGTVLAEKGAVVGAINIVGASDRLTWLCGFDAEPGTSFDDSLPIHIPPAGIPLMGATWTRVDSEADRRVIFDRHRRNQGYMWGAALVWRCRLTMHRWALEALQTGWCLRGKVTLGCADMLGTPVSVSEPAGAITGFALGLDSVRWLDSIQQTAVVEMSIVTE